MSTTDEARRRLFASSLWLHVGYAGGTAAAAGLLHMNDGPNAAAAGAALALAGGAVAVASWRRGLKILATPDRGSIDAHPCEGSARVAKGVGRHAVDTHWTRILHRDLLASDTGSGGRPATKSGRSALYFCARRSLNSMFPADRPRF